MYRNYTEVYRNYVEMYRICRKFCRLLDPIGEKLAEKYDDAVQDKAWMMKARSSNSGESNSFPKVSNFVTWLKD